MLGVFGDAIDWADIHALGGVIMPHALGAQAGVNDVDLIASTDRFVGADRFAYVTVDTFISDE